MNNLYKKQSRALDWYYTAEDKILFLKLYIKHNIFVITSKVMELNKQETYKQTKQSDGTITDV